MAVPTVYEAMKTAFPQAIVQYEAGASIGNLNTSGIAAAVALAKRSDVAVVVLGDDLKTSSEWGDRDSLDLPGGQLALLNAVVASGTPVILVTVTGRTPTYACKLLLVPPPVSTSMMLLAKGNQSLNLRCGADQVRWTRQHTFGQRHCNALRLPAGSSWRDRHRQPHLRQGDPQRQAVAELGALGRPGDVRRRTVPAVAGGQVGGQQPFACRP